MPSPLKAPARITKPTFSPRKAGHRKHRSLPSYRIDYQSGNILLSMADEGAQEGMPPSPHERRWYYYGLPSHPKLLARSSAATAPWVDLDEVREPPIKMLFPASPRHPIAPLWESGTLGEEIKSSLRGIDWVAIDILRVGYTEVTYHSHDLEKRHTLLVSVIPNSTSWRRAHAAVMACRATLQRYGINDVHCEMKESQLNMSMLPNMEAPLNQLSLPAAPLNSPRLIAQSEQTGDRADIYDRAMLSECIGASINAFQYPGIQGTKGPYIRRKDTGDIMAITCRHVVFGEGYPNIEHQHSAGLHWTVIQPGNKSLREITQSVSDGIEANRRLISTIRSNTKLEEEVREARIKNFTEMVDRALLWKESLDKISTASSCIFGHVCFSPPFDIGKSPVGEPRVRDWALISLHQPKHSSQLAELRNRVPITEPVLKSLQMIATKLTPDYQPACISSIVDTMEWLDLHDTVPEAEIRNPITLDANGFPIMIVAKFGSSSQFTIGVINPLKSILCKRNGILIFTSEEWLIVGAQKTTSISRTPFSRGGDSGSCIWDMAGRVVGILTSGTGAGDEEINDTTYATPIEWLLKDITLKLGAEVELVE